MGTMGDRANYRHARGRPRALVLILLVCLATVLSHHLWSRCWICTGRRWVRRPHTTTALGATDHDNRCHPLRAQLHANYSRRWLLGGGCGSLCLFGSGTNGEVGAAVAGTRLFGGKILQSPSDDRAYQSVVLQNGLRVLLVSDSSATAAAAALSVHAGSYLDPPDLPGLAHFCEHMLFLGTKEYPEESSFRQFISSNGGSQNAFTEEQDTTYFFDVSPFALREGLLRFGSFFSSPLFTASATDRELNAIESEDAKNRQSDSFRLNQLAKSFADERHPQRKFSTGNKESLLTEPAQRGIDTRAALLDFFAKYYDASQMSLCVVGREPLQTLQAWVEEAFGKLVGGSAPSPTLVWRGINPYPPLKQQERPLFLEAVPVAERRSVSVSWPIVFESQEARDEWMRSKPYAFVNYLLGHEGEGSLQSILKKRGWVNKILVGAVRDDDNFAVLRVGFDVTAQGLKNREAVIESLYAVIRDLRKGIPDYVFAQCAAIAELRWRFQEKAPSLGSALSYVQQMQKGSSPEEYVSGRMLLFKPRLGTIQDSAAAVLAQLTPERAQHTAVAKDYETERQSVERWYGTRYSLVPIPAAVFQRWRLPTPFGYALPKPNLFVPTDFAMKAPQASGSERPEAIARPPTLVLGSDRWQIFYKEDQAFGLPKANVQIFLWMPSNTVDEDAVPSRLWQIAITERLTETFYDASLAGFSFEIANAVEGVTLEFAGYSDKLVLFIKEVISRIRDFDGPTQEEFERGLDIVRREQTSFDKQQPYQYAAYSSRLAITTPEYSIEFLRQQAAAVSLADARRFAAQFRSRSQRFFGQALIHGNVNMADLKQVQGILEGLPFKPLKREDFTRVRVVQLPPGREAIVVKAGPNPAEVNHAVHCVFLTGSEPKLVLMTQLLQSLLETPFFSRIRTQMQLGYIVLSQADRLGGLVGRLGLFIQSSTATPDRLLEAIDQFLKDFRDDLSALPVAQLSSYKVSLVERIVKQDERLTEETGRWWQEISLFQYNWRRRESDANIVAKITKTDLIEFFDTFISPAGSKRQRIASAIFSPRPEHKVTMAKLSAESDARGAIVIKDPSAFCASLPQYPLEDLSPELSDRD